MVLVIVSYPDPPPERRGRGSGFKIQGLRSLICDWEVVKIFQRESIFCKFWGGEEEGLGTRLAFRVG